MIWQVVKIYALVQLLPWATEAGKVAETSLNSVSTPSIRLVIICDQPYMSELRFSFSIGGGTTKLNVKNILALSCGFFFLFPVQEPFNIRAGVQVSFDAGPIH